MYLWNVKKLKSKLKTGKMSERNKFEYVLASVVLISLGFISMSLYTPNDYDFYDNVIQAVLGIFGTYYLYRCNGGSKGKNFLQNFVSLNFVCTIRWLVMMFIPLLIVYSTVAAYFLGIADETTLDAVIFYTVMSIILYLYIGKHIKDVRKK